MYLSIFNCDFHHFLKDQILNNVLTINPNIQDFKVIFNIFLIISQYFIHFLSYLLNNLNILINYYN